MTNTLEVNSIYLQWMTQIGSKLVNSTKNALFMSMELMTNPSHFGRTSPSLRPNEEAFQTMGKLQDDFISTATHELRTPLTSIRALSKILHDNPDLETTQREKFLDIIVQESEKLTEVVEEVLELAELELGSIDWRLSEVDLKEIIEEALKTVKKLPQAKSVQLQVRLPDRVPPVVADHDRLLEVVLGLLTNAINCCDDSSGWVGLRLCVGDEFLQVDVSDNGPGIHDNCRPVIADRFNHSNSSCTTEEPPPTSLALLISRDVMSHFGGKMWVDEALTHGAKFSFILPLAGAGKS